MPARRIDKTTIYPLPTATDPFPSYAHGGGFRYVVRGTDGAEEKSPTFRTKAKAAEAREERQRLIDGVTDVNVDEALGAYEVVLRSERENKPGSVYQTMRKLRTMFPDGGELLEALDGRRCEALYMDLRTRGQPRLMAMCVKAAAARGLRDWPAHDMGIPGCVCKPYAADYHRNALAESKTFLRWCVKQKYIVTNHMEGVEGVGRRKKGKPQLRIDESRRWLATAHHYASVKGEEGAVAAMIAMLIGLRAASITRIKVRDFDDNGTRLHVADSKTETSDGWHDVPEELQPYMAALCKGKQPDALMWNRQHWRDWPTAWVEKLCAAAVVPRVTAHGMRAFFMSLDYLGGRAAAEQQTMAAGGHTNFAVTRGYIDPSAIARVTQRRVMKVLKGGK